MRLPIWIAVLLCFLTVSPVYADRTKWEEDGSSTTKTKDATDVQEQKESSHTSCRQRCLEDGEDPYDCDDYCIQQASVPALPELLPADICRR